MSRKKDGGLEKFYSKLYFKNYRLNKKKWTIRTGDIIVRIMIVRVRIVFRKYRDKWKYIIKIELESLGDGVLN